MLTSPKQRRNWTEVLRVAEGIIARYETSVTLRQLFYRLVAAEVLPNTKAAYQSLSRVSAKARRAGTFPALIDQTRTIHRYQAFTSPGYAKSWLQSIYRRDRTEGQFCSIYLGVEKAGIVEQLRACFGDLGVPILALGGYSSQSYVDEVVHDVRDQDRTAILIYAGDFDPSGEDIDRDFLQRTACFEEVVRVALTSEQVREYDLPEQMGKATDSRAKGFVARHGRLVQVELDALPPDELHALYQGALNEFWDQDAHDDVVAAEEQDRHQLGGRM